MQTLPGLPLHYLSMRVYYRDHCTPPEFEPVGFERAASGGLCFDSPPLHMRVAGLETGFHTMSCEHFSTLVPDWGETEGARQPTHLQCKKDAAGQGKQTYLLDLDKEQEQSATPPCALPHDEPPLDDLLPIARRHVEDATQGTLLTTSELRRVLAVDELRLAERVARRLEEERLLSRFQPSLAARTVRKRSPACATSGDESHDSHSQSESEEPRSKRCNSQTMPLTPALSASGPQRKQSVSHTSIAAGGRASPAAAPPAATPRAHTRRSATPPTAAVQPIGRPRA